MNNLINYLYSLSESSDKTCGDLNEYGIAYRLYGKENLNLVDQVLLGKFTLSETEKELLEKNKFVIVSETSGGEKEYQLFASKEDAINEFDAIEEDIRIEFEDFYDEYSEEE